MKTMKRLMAAVLSAALLITTVWSTPMATNASARVTVTVSVEKFVIGQGYVVEPTRMEVRKGSQVSDVFESLMKQEGKTFTLSSYGYFVDAIEDKDRGDIKVSDTLKKALEAKLDYNGNPLTLNPVDETPDMLGSYDYCSYAGWMFMVNDIQGYETMDATEVNNGDVIRIQFSLMGGDDISPVETDWQTPVYPNMPERSQITRILGYVNAQVKADENYLEAANLKAAYENGHALATNLETSKEDMEAAEKAFGLTIEDKTSYVDDVKVHSVKKTSASDVKKAYTNAISATKKAKKATYGNEWTVITLKKAKASNCKEYYNSYLKNLKSTLKKNKGKLPNGKPTDYARVSLALSALGKNPAKFEGYNLLKNLTDVEKVAKQGLNGTIYALYALDAAKYTDKKGTRKALIDGLLGAQLSDGGFAYTGKRADADMTAMAINALAPYYKKAKYENVTAAIDEALITLSDMQQSNGSFYSLSVCNAESNAQVVLALCSLGINPRTDARFVKNGKSVMDALMSFRTTGGKFKHLIDGKANALASTQATYALTAYWGRS